MKRGSRDDWNGTGRTLATLIEVSTQNSNNLDFTSNDIVAQNNNLNSSESATLTFSKELTLDCIEMSGLDWQSK